MYNVFRQCSPASLGPARRKNTYDARTNSLRTRTKCSKSHQLITNKHRALSCRLGPRGVRQTSGCVHIFEERICAKCVKWHANIAQALQHRRIPGRIMRLHIFMMTHRALQCRLGTSVRTCVCLLLQDLVQSCLRGEGGILEDMCYERRRAEACVDYSAHHAPVNAGEREIV